MSHLLNVSGGGTSTYRDILSIPTDCSVQHIIDMIYDKLQCRMQQHQEQEQTSQTAAAAQTLPFQKSQLRLVYKGHLLSSDALIRTHYGIYGDESLVYVIIVNDDEEEKKQVSSTPSTSISPSTSTSASTSKSSSTSTSPSTSPSAHTYHIGRDTFQSTPSSSLPTVWSPAESQQQLAQQQLQQLQAHKSLSTQQ